MNSLDRRISAIERSTVERRQTWLVRTREGEMAGQAIARTESLAPFIVIAPEACRTSEEWVHRYARTWA